MGRKPRALFSKLRGALGVSNVIFGKGFDSYMYNILEVGYEELKKI